MKKGSSLRKRQRHDVTSASLTTDTHITMGVASEPQQAGPISAGRFRRHPASSPALQHAIKHEVVPQLLTPELAAFMPDGRIAVRCHADEQCCVDTVTFIAESSPLSGVDIQYLQQLPHLAHVFVKERAIDAAAFAALAKLTQLQGLFLSDCGGVNATALADVAKCSRLQHLSLSECRGVDAAGLGRITQHTHLRHLDVSWCHGVDTSGIAEVAKCTTLQHLNLSRCRGVDVAGLAEVAKLSQLQHLDLSWCDGVDAAGLAQVAKLTRLRHLDLFGCRGVQDDGLPEIAKLKQLQRLHLTARCGIDARSLPGVQVKLKRLQLSRR